MNKASGFLLKWLTAVAAILAVAWLTWRFGVLLNWSWSDFWSNLISNAASSAVIGFVLYWIITRPDEKKARLDRKNQALAMLKIEFEINLERARAYETALKKPPKDFASLYPLRFTRGAWNALKESGFLPQFEDVEFIYELLRVNEVITVANNSLLKVRNAQADNQKTKLTTYAKKAIKEFTQIETLLEPILRKLERMHLPKVRLPETVDLDDEDDRD